MPSQRHPGADLDRDALQPPVSVDEAELTGLVSDEVAARMGRLEADAGLVVTLALNNYRGRQWERFVSVLVRYAHDVLCSWIRRRQIHQVCRSKGIRLTLLPKTMLRVAALNRGLRCRPNDGDRTGSEGARRAARA